MLRIENVASSSSGNALAVGRLLFDCGVSYSRLLSKLDLWNFEACFVTHEHLDHAKAAEELSKRGIIPVYASPGTLDYLELDNEFTERIDPLEKVSRSNWVVKPFEVEHDSQEPVGFLWKYGGEKGVYIADASFTKYKFNGLNHIAISCNYSKEILEENVKNGLVPYVQKRRLLESHASLEYVLKFLKDNDLSRVREIILLHLSGRNSDAKVFKRTVQEATGKPVKVAAKSGGYMSV